MSQYPTQSICPQMGSLSCFKPGFLTSLSVVNAVILLGLESSVHLFFSTSLSATVPKLANFPIISSCEIMHTSAKRVAQQVKIPDTKPDKRSSIPETQMVEGESGLWPPHVCCGMHMTIYAHKRMNTGKI